MQLRNTEIAADPRRIHRLGEDCADQIIRAQEKVSMHRRLLEELDRLPPAQRKAVYYCGLGGLRPAELAAMEGVSAHAVSARLYRGIESLRRALTQPPKETE